MMSHALSTTALLLGSVIKLSRVDLDPSSGVGVLGWLPSLTRGRVLFYLFVYLLDYSHESLLDVVTVES